MKLYKDKGHEPANLDKVGLSIVSGALGALVGNPFDVALIRRQASITENKVPYRNTLDAFLSIIQKEGVLALWTGINITILRVALINIGQMASNDIIKTYFASIPGLEKLPALSNSLSAILASLITSVISLPADNIKVKLQKSEKG